MFFIAEGVAGGDVFEAYRCGDVAGVCGVDFLPVIGVHLKDTAYAFFLSFRGVQNVGALMHFAGIYAEVRELADEGVGHDLEGKSGERRLIVSRTFQLFFRFGSVPLTGGTSSGDGR